jgi:single-stranded-DNA-specific exonuclease
VKPNQLGYKMPPMKKKWTILEPDPTLVNTLRHSLGCSRILARVLANRNLQSLEQARAFLHPSLGDLQLPDSLKDVEIAAHRIVSAINRKEKILVFGDYDADGITATAILYDFLKKSDVAVTHYIPHRTREGYSLQPDQIQHIASSGEVDLLITVDCGSESHMAVKAANDSGIDVIITDHHRINLKLPEAIAVLNPKKGGWFAGAEDLAGVGVVFYLLIYLRKTLRDQGFWTDRPEPNLKKICGLVAVGTIADMVPLTGINRIITHAGLEILMGDTQPGVKALLETCRITAGSLNAEDIAFKLAPRLNAAGRMAHASEAVELLTTRDPEMAKKIAESLEMYNSRRREIQQQTTDEITALIRADPGLLGQQSLVLSGAGWHEGVLGIVASRLVNQYQRPVILISVKNGIGKGSARSIPGVDIYEGLSLCKDLLENFGGHTMAAGLKIQEHHILGFQKKFDNAVLGITETEGNEPALLLDDELLFSQITHQLVDSLERLGPFGFGNPEPLFLAKNIDVVSSRGVGDNHRQFVLRQKKDNDQPNFNAIWFNIEPENADRKFFKQIAFKICWNRWNGKKRIQLNVVET